MCARKCMHNAMGIFFFCTCFAYGKLLSTAVENEGLYLSAAKIEQIPMVQISFCSALCMIRYHHCKNRAICKIFVPGKAYAPFQGMRVGY